MNKRSAFLVILGVLVLALGGFSLVSTAGESKDPYANAPWKSPDYQSKILWGDHMEEGGVFHRNLFCPRLDKTDPQPMDWALATTILEKTPCRHCKPAKPADAE